MQNGLKPPRQDQIPSKRGFALIITVSLMVLLSLLAVGALTLSSSALRSAARGQAEAEAKANARLAMAMALGELQLQMGPDQRVSANGGILTQSEVSNPHWLGVWESWKAGPGERSEHQTINPEAGTPHQMSPPYVPGRQDFFRSWLVSLTESETSAFNSAASLALNGSSLPGRDDIAVELVGSGTLGEAALVASPQVRVSARLLGVAGSDSSSDGRFGWWVGDESQKAHIMPDPHAGEQGVSLAERIFRTQAPGSTGTSRVPGLGEIDDEAMPRSVPSILSLDLIAADEGSPPSQSFHAITTHSYAPLTDVREGGLKRDLNTLLERPIRRSGAGDPLETGDEFMLYKFGTKDAWLGGQDNQEAVPIHDLAAYYQLYDSGRSGWKEGVRYSSNVLTSAIHTVAPDFGGKNAAGKQMYDSAYTTLYRQPVPVKLQFLLSMFAEPIPGADASDPNQDTHELIVGITPSMTFWNPNNVPMTMRLGDPKRYAQTMRMMNLPLHLQWIKNGGEFTSRKKNLSWLTTGNDSYKPHIFNLYFSGVRPVRYEPGEVKTFSLPYNGDVRGIKRNQRVGSRWHRWHDLFFKTDTYYEPLEVVEGWEPQSFMLTGRSAAGSNEHVRGGKMTFRAGDRISFRVTADNPYLSAGNWIMFFMNQSNHQDYAGGGTWGRRNYQISGRSGGRSNDHVSFNESIMTQGFPGGANMVTAPERSGNGIIQRSNNNEGWPFLQFSFMAGTETNAASNGGAAGGRKFASRPFLHSTPIRASQLSDNSREAFYNYGWNWFVEPINSVFEAPVQVTPDNHGYWGGGYTPESGTTHVVQQEIPLVPPISLASLSHAHLGGFSIAKSEVRYAGGTQSQQVTATGQSGLFPHTVQAIGNSYAHPHVPADQGYAEWSRTPSDGAARPVILADHSYLANKALWDEFFFSSIAPQPASLPVYDGGSRTARQVAEAFFEGDGRLPNSRLVPYTANMDETRLGELFGQADQFRDGLADKIAAHLMVRGPFNVNSTSVDAWRILLSSLKGTPVAYRTPVAALSSTGADTASADGVPVSGFGLANGEPETGSTADPSEPQQWLAWRELTDSEIDELAQAIVKQVRLRGPFLSLSEFINRRLDSGNPELSLKGALQAAIDDLDVSINSGFRSAARQFSSDEQSGMNAAFPEALEGPVAYGSAAYVDQADLLRSFSAQLTPRGDTFVIRTYGDSLDANGNVVARAWCEAVVQRVPDYVDPVDEAHVSRDELGSSANREFGRQLRIIRFRWLSPTEI